MEIDSVEGLEDRVFAEWAEIRSIEMRDEGGSFT